MKILLYYLFLIPLCTNVEIKSNSTNDLKYILISPEVSENSTAHHLQTEGILKVVTKSGKTYNLKNGAIYRDNGGIGYGWVKSIYLYDSDDNYHTINVSDINTISISSSFASESLMWAKANIKLRNGSSISGKFSMGYIEGINTSTGSSLRITTGKIDYIVFY